MPSGKSPKDVFESLRKGRNHADGLEVTFFCLFVRFTVNMQKNNDGVHSHFATDVNLYNTNSVSGLSYPDLLGARVTANGIIDTKLENFFDVANVFSKVVDEIGEPVVISDNYP